MKPPKLPDNLVRAVAIQRLLDKPTVNDHVRVSPSNEITDDILNDWTFWSWQQREKIAFELACVYPESKVIDSWKEWSSDDRMHISSALMNARKARRAKS